jgi:hypothetical protein
MVQAAGPVDGDVCGAPVKLHSATNGAARVFGAVLIQAAEYWAVLANRVPLQCFLELLLLKQGEQSCDLVINFLSIPRRTGTAGMHIQRQHGHVSYKRAAQQQT